MVTSRLLFIAAAIPAALFAQGSPARTVSDSSGVAPAPYAAAGIAVGAPGSVNATLAWHERNWTARVAGGVGGAGHSGVQGELAWHTWTTENLVLGPALIAGTYRGAGATPDNRPDGSLRSTTFAGLAVDAWLAGFRLQVGAGLGSGADPHMLLVQLGWEWRIAGARGGDR